tara:strand:+ start:1154 stop:1360 length:207 start_codon:yes stop_codon:yes gene_type:complete
MPTNNEEAASIVSVIDSHVDHEIAKQIVNELEEKVARVTDNDSLRITLEMLKALYWPDFVPDHEYRNP